MIATQLRRGKHRAGFTIIEIIVVLAIVVLFAAVVFAALGSARAKARDSQRISTARAVKSALALYEDKYGGVAGINGLSLGAGAALLVASGTKSIADVLNDEGFMTRKIASDLVFGASEYYLGISADGKYDVYVKLERPESAMSSSTISLAADGASALSAGYNYVTGFGVGVGGAGGGVVATGAGGSASAAVGEQVYSAAGTTNFIVPANVTSVSVVCVGAGGGGSSAPLNSGNPGLGGGGGGAAYENNIPVTPGESLTITVGLRGDGAAYTGGTGNNGAGTLVTRTLGGALCEALGGAAGGTDSSGGNGNIGTGIAKGGRGGRGDGALFNSAARLGDGYFAAGGGGYYRGGSGGSGGGASSLQSATMLFMAIQNARGVYDSSGIPGIGVNGGLSGQPGVNSGAVDPYSGTNNGSAGGDGAWPGGGGGGGWYNSSGGHGAHGGVRIVWPGSSRQFPSTGTNTP